MAEVLRSPIEQWRLDFETDPLDALDRLLTGRVSLGRLNRNAPDELLFRLFHVADASHLDEALQQWFARYWGTAAASMPAVRWAEVLNTAFDVVPRLALPQTQTWLHDQRERGRTWLRSLYLGPARDPEAAFLRALALTQRDQQLLPLWARLCRLEEDRPLHFFTLGLLGLRKLPDENGAPPGDLSLPAIKGMVDAAEAVYRQARPRKEGMRIWKLRVRAILARYPRTDRYWTERFFPFVQDREHRRAAEELGRILPLLRSVLNGERQVKPLTIYPPSKKERETMLQRLGREPLHAVRPSLEIFLNRYRMYTRQTGHPDFLVKTFSNVGKQIRRHDPDFALELFEEAFHWAPNNAYLWTGRAEIERQLGRIARAAVLLWEARYRFPENSVVRTSLAELLEAQKEFELAQTIYRQTVEAFPKDVFARTGLAEVLKARGRLAESEQAYRQTVEAFPQNVVARNALAEVLKAKQQLDESTPPTPEAEEPVPRDTPADTERRSEPDAFDSTEDVQQAQPEEPVASEQAADVGPPALPESLRFEEAEAEVFVSMASFFRQAARQAQANDQATKADTYGQIFEAAYQAAQARNAGSLGLKLERGFALLDQDLGEAASYFDTLCENQSNVLGFRLGRLAAHARQGQTIEPEQWGELEEDFPNRATLIALEHARYALRQSNGITVPALENLRHKLAGSIQRIPVSLHAKEEWLRSTVEYRLFDGLTLNGEPIEALDLAQIQDNHVRHEMVLQEIVEQSLAL